MDLKYYLEQLKLKEKKRYRHQLDEPKEAWSTSDEGYSLVQSKPAEEKSD